MASINQRLTQTDAYADNIPTLIASLISATLAGQILRALFSERELLFALFALLTVSMTGVTYLAKILFKLDDGIIDRFEHANLRPLTFISSVLYFLTMQFGVGILADALGMYQMPLLPDLLLATVVVLATAFFLFPYFISISERRPPSKGTKKEH